MSRLGARSLGSRLGAAAGSRLGAFTVPGGKMLVMGGSHGGSGVAWTVPRASLPDAGNASLDEYRGSPVIQGLTPDLISAGVNRQGPFFGGITGSFSSRAFHVQQASAGFGSGGPHGAVALPEVWASIRTETDTNEPLTDNVNTRNSVLHPYRTKAGNGCGFTVILNGQDRDSRFLHSMMFCETFEADGTSQDPEVFWGDSERFAESAVTICESEPLVWASAGVSGSVVTAQWANETNKGSFTPSSSAPDNLKATTERGGVCDGAFERKWGLQVFNLSAQGTRDSFGFYDGSTTDSAALWLSRFTINPATIGEGVHEQGTTIREFGSEPTAPSSLSLGFNKFFVRRVVDGQLVERIVAVANGYGPTPAPIFPGPYNSNAIVLIIDPATHALVHEYQTPVKSLPFTSGRVLVSSADIDAAGNIYFATYGSASGNFTGDATLYCVSLQGDLVWSKSFGGSDTVVRSVMVDF
ncbi:MAG: hypothetical protein AAGE65_07850 [Planctomycetota bacterium]